MSKFAIHSIDDAPDHAREVLGDVQNKYGFIPNLLGALSEAPTVAQSYMSIAQSLADSSLTKEERHVAWFTVNVEHDCGYCMAAHSGIAKKEGVDAAIIQSARDNAPYDDARLESLRTFVQQLVRQRGWLEESKVDEFLAAGFTRRNVFELLLVIAHKTLSNYTNHLVETPVDEVFSAFAWQPPARQAAE